MPEQAGLESHFCHFVNPWTPASLLDNPEGPVKTGSNTRAGRSKVDKVVILALLRKSVQK